MTGLIWCKIVLIFSSGRDQLLVLWDIIKKTSIRSLPVYENIEASFIIPSCAKLPVQSEQQGFPIYAASAGEKGMIVFVLNCVH